MKKKKELAYSRALVLKKGSLYKKIATCIIVVITIAVILLLIN